MNMTIEVGRCLKRMTMLVQVKKYIITNFVTCKRLCNLQKSYTAFREKSPNINIGFSKQCVLASSKMIYSVCVCSSHQIVVLIVHAMNWNLTQKDLMKKMVCNIDSSKCLIHRCESCLDTATLKKFLCQELNEHEDDEKFKYCQWDTSHIDNLYSHLRRVQKDFD